MPQSLSSLFPFPEAPSRKSTDRVVRQPMRNDGAKHRAMANHRERLSISRQQVILAAITLAATILRLTHLGTESFWIDEVSQAKTASLIGELGWRAVASRDNVSPLSHIILWVLQGMFGYSETVARLPSAIAGILLVPVTYSLGRRLVSDRVGLIAALVIAINPYGLWYSRDARMYALLSLWCAVYLLCLLNLLRDPGRRWAIVLALVSCIGLYIHEYFIFALVGSIGYVVVTRFQSNRMLVYRLLLVGGIAVAAFVPWILAMSSYNPGTAGVARSSILFFAPYTLLTFLIGFNFGPSVREMQIEGAATAMRHELGLVVVPVLALVVVAGALFFSLRARIRSRKPENDGIISADDIHRRDDHWTGRDRGCLVSHQFQCSLLRGGARSGDHPLCDRFRRHATPQLRSHLGGRPGGHYACRELSSSLAWHSICEGGSSWSESLFVVEACGWTTACGGLHGGAGLAMVWIQRAADRGVESVRLLGVGGCQWFVR